MTMQQQDKKWNRLLCGRHFCIDYEVSLQNFWLVTWKDIVPPPVKIPTGGDQSQWYWLCHSWPAGEFWSVFLEGKPRIGLLQCCAFFLPKEQWWMIQTSLVLHRSLALLWLQFQFGTKWLMSIYWNKLLCLHMNWHNIVKHVWGMKSKHKPTICFLYRLLHSSLVLYLDVEWCLFFVKFLYRG